MVMHVKTKCMTVMTEKERGKEGGRGLSCDCGGSRNLDLHRKQLICACFHLVSSQENLMEETDHVRIPCTENMVTCRETCRPSETTAVKWKKFPSTTTGIPALVEH